jgi:hypothetical protein
VLLGELVAEQEHRQHDVGLLDHLVPVDHQRVIVQQQREFLWRCGIEVPLFAAEEGVILRVDAAVFIEGHVHRRRSAFPGLGLVRRELDLVASAV